jgi:hypothetical protein
MLVVYMGVECGEEGRCWAALRQWSERFCVVGAGAVSLTTQHKTLHNLFAEWLDRLKIRLVEVEDSGKK